MFWGLGEWVEGVQFCFCNMACQTCIVNQLCTVYCISTLNSASSEDRRTKEISWEVLHWYLLMFCSERVYSVSANVFHTFHLHEYVMYFVVEKGIMDRYKQKWMGKNCDLVSEKCIRKQVSEIKLSMPAVCSLRGSAMLADHVCEKWNLFRAGLKQTHFSGTLHFIQSVVDGRDTRMRFLSIRAPTAISYIVWQKESQQSLWSGSIIHRQNT